MGSDVERRMKTLPTYETRTLYKVAVLHCFVHARVCGCVRVREYMQVVVDFSSSCFVFAVLEDCATSVDNIIVYPYSGLDCP